LRNWGLGKEREKCVLPGAGKKRSRGEAKAQKEGLLRNERQPWVDGFEWCCFMNPIRLSSCPRYLGKEVAGLGEVLFCDRPGSVSVIQSWYNPHWRVRLD